MQPETIFPWQASQWQQVWQSHQQGRLSHALLLSGMSGIGKKHFAQVLAHSLLCITPSQEGVACGECRSCHLLRAGSHPDLSVIEPEETGQVIKIDQIRELVGFVNESAGQGGYRVIIIRPANAMNVNASNALLKSLEEPTPRCLFILVSDQSARLSATIRSRCQKMYFQKPEYDKALHCMSSLSEGDLTRRELALRLSNGAPLKALELLSGNFLTQRQDLYQGLFALSQAKADPVQFAVRWQEMDFRMLFDLMHNWLRDLLKLKLTHGNAEVINADFNESYAHLIKKLSIKNLIRYIDYVQKTDMNISGPCNLNRQMVLEQLFIEWVKHVSC
jgi:DNA polymerase-3 subunit delta'